MYFFIKNHNDKTRNMQFKLFSSTKTFIFVLIAIFLLIAIKIPYSQEPLNSDEASYGYIAKQILSGETPYKDIFDHKPPAIYYTYALIFQLFGSEAQNIRLLAIFWSILNLIAVFFLAKKIYGKNTAIFTAFIFAFFSGGRYFAHGMTANTETFLLLFQIIGIYFLLIGLEKNKNKYLFISGFVVGIGFLYKQIAVIHLLFLISYAYLTKFFRTNKKIFLEKTSILVVGFTIPILFILGLFFLKNSLKETLFAIFEYNIFYVKDGTYFSNDYILYIIFFRFTEMIMKWEFIPLFLLSVLGGITILKKNRDLALLIYQWVFFSAITLMMGGERLAGHYFIVLVPPLAILAGCGLNYIYDYLKTYSLSVKTIAYSTILILAFAFIFPQFYYKSLRTDIHNEYYYFNIHRELGEYIKKQINPGDYIYASDVDPSVYFYADAKSPIKYIYHSPLYLYIYAQNKKYERYELKRHPDLKNIILQLESTKPKIIIIPKELSLGFSPIYSLLKTYYTKKTSLYWYNIYQLN